MELWQEMIRNSVTSVDHLVEKFSIDREVAEKLDQFYGKLGGEKSSGFTFMFRTVSRYYEEYSTFRLDSTV